MVLAESQRRADARQERRGHQVAQVSADIIARDCELGHKLAVDGTPAIFLPSGEMLPGYAPPAQLAKYLKTGKV